jgi:hypothetical protein
MTKIILNDHDQAKLDALELESKECTDCGETKTIKFFQVRKREFVEGPSMYRLDVCGKCLQCERKVTAGAWRKKRYLHTGPLDPIERLFFCQVRPTL